MLGPGDMLIIGAAALLFFGPDQLPKVAKRAGQAMREVQNTSQAFLREMERAADEPDMYAVPPRIAEPHVPEPIRPAIDLENAPAAEPILAEHEPSADDTRRASFDV